MQRDLSVIQGEQGFGDISERTQFVVLFSVVLLHVGQEVDAHDDVLRRRHDRIAVRRGEDVVSREHQEMCFDLRLDRERQVDGHLVAVEVGVVTRAHQGVQRDRVAFDEHRLEGLDAHAVQGRCTVQENRMLVDDLLEDIPDLGVTTLEHALGRLDRIGKAVLLELADDEGLVQLQCDLLGKAALVKLEFRADDDHRTSGVVDTLAQEVLTEPTLLALDHVGQGLQRAVARTEDGSTAATVVEERIDRLLQHALLVSNDDLGCIEIHQLLQTVVPVDDAAIEIIEIRGGEVARFQQNQRSQIRRNDRNDVEDHPGGVVTALTELFDQLQSLGEVLDALLRACLGQLFTNLGGNSVQIEITQQFGDGISAHQGLEGAVAMGLEGGAVLVLVHDLLHFQLGVTGIDDDVVLEVDHLLQISGLHLKQGSETAWKRLEEPDVHDRGGEVDVAHPLATDAGVSHFHPATVADDALVLRALVLAATTFVVPLGTEDAFAEETVLFRTVGAIVDRLGFLDLTEAPTPDVVGAGEGDPDGCKVVHAIENAFGAFR